MSAATPTNLKLTPGIESLVVSWGVSGESLGGFLLHYRAKGTTSWATITLASTVRSYVITGLAAAVEVQVRALVAGGLASANATPLAPEPPPVEPSGDILWVADGTASLDTQIASMSTQEHCGVVATSSNVGGDRLHVVSEPRFSKGKAVQATMRAGDTCFSGRSEANFGNPPKTGFHKGQYHPGDEAWVAGELMYGPNYPIGANDKGDHCGGTNFQFHSWGGVGAATLGLCCNADSSPEKYGRIETWGEQKSMQTVFDKAEVGKVYKIVFHMKFAEKGGLAEVYFAEGPGQIGSPVLKAQYLDAFTINPAGTYEGKITNFVCFGFYENTNRKGESRGEVLWAGLTGATTRSAAEASAFSA